MEEKHGVCGLPQALGVQSEFSVEVFITYHVSDLLCDKISYRLIIAQGAD